MSTIRKKWKRYLCMVLTMILLTTSIGGCGFFGNQNASVNSDVIEEGTEDKDGEESGSPQETKDPEAEGEDTDWVDVSADWSVFWYVDGDSIHTQQETLGDLEDCQGVQILLGGNTDSSWYAFENGTGYEVEHAQGADLEAFLEQFKEQYVGDKVIFIYSADADSTLSGKDFAQKLSDAFGTDEEHQPIDLLVLDTRNKELTKKASEYINLARYMSYYGSKNESDLDFANWFLKLSKDVNLSMVEAAYSLADKNGKCPFQVIEVSNPKTIIKNPYAKQATSTSTSQTPSTSTNQTPGTGTNQTSGASTNQTPSTSTSQGSTDNTSQKPTDDSSQKPTDDSGQKPTDDPSQKPSEPSTEQPEVLGAPKATPAGGSYTSNQLVELRCSTAGADIYYTTDGTTPSSTNGTKYEAPISVVGTEGQEAVTTIKAIAVKSGMEDSEVATFTYTIQIPDTTSPTAEITIGTSKWNQFWNTVTFGKFFKNTKQVTITAADNVTASPEIKYYLSDNELTESEAKADSISWEAYGRAFNIDANSKKIVYAKVTDEAGNTTIVNSEGIVVYTDSVASTTDITYVKNVSGDVTADVLLNGNTVAGISNGSDALTSGTDYTVDAEGTITFKDAYLKTLPVAAYTLTVSYNPMGEAYQSVSGNDAPTTTRMTLTVRNPKLVSVTQPDAITGVENGTEKTAEALGLPETVTIVTEDTQVTTANVTWDLTDLAEGTYDPSVQQEQSFIVKGAVALPEGISNADNISRDVTIQVTVSAIVVNPNQNYSVTLYNEDTELKKVEKAAGTVLANINSPYVDEKIFLGWYYDKALTQKVNAEDVLSEDVSLYGNYGDAIPLTEGGSSNLLGAVDVEPDFTIYLNANTTTAEASDVRQALMLTNLTTPSRTDDSDTLEKDELIVSSLGGGRFSVTAKDGYERGATYQLEIVGNEEVPDLTFEGQTTDVIYYNFAIKKEEVLNLSLDKDVIYLAAAALSSEDAQNIMAYTGLYEAVVNPETGETTYQPTNTFGTFTYEGATFIAGDIIAVYEGIRPDNRDLDSPSDGIAYIEITEANEANYSYKSAEAIDVLFTPDIIPIDVDAGDGVTGWTDNGTSFTIDSSKLDFTTGYEDMGLDFETVVESGDYVAFYTGDFGSESAEDIGYGKIVSVREDGDSTSISYVTATYEEVLASMDIYNESDLTEEQLDAIDEQMIVSSVTNQVLESGFAQEAGMYLATLAVETDEVKDMLGESNLELKDCTITYQDGTPVPTDEVMLMANVLTGGGNGAPEISVNVSKGLNHFTSGTGFQVELALKYGFDISKNGSPGKIHIEMTAIFQTEVMLRFSASGGAEWRTKWIFPYIYDYKMSGNIDQGLYTNIAITATAQLQGNDIVEGPDMLEPGDTKSDNTNKEQLVNLSESIKEMMEEYKQRDPDSDEAGEVGLSGLTDKYQKFIEGASDQWIELVSVPIFSSEGTLDPFYITAYSINVDFVVSATMSVTIGMSFQYEKQQRTSFTLRLIHGHESSSNTVDLTPERYQFDFYVMGMLGVRAGVRAKVLFGVFSVKLAGIGMQMEVGAYAKLWGYFYYCLSWEQGRGKESSATGALYVEIGIYLKINLVLEVLNGKFSYCPQLYAKEWPIWHAGEENNALRFAYDEEGNWQESIYKLSVPLSFDMLRKKDMIVPSEIFRMYYMNLKDGSLGYATYDGNVRGSNNSTSSKYDDEERFFVEISEPFSYDPVTNTITVTPEEGRYSYEGTMTITWKQPDITFNSKPLTKTFEVSWVDPDKGYCLAFETNGGTIIRTKVYDAGKEVEEIPDPTKIGYAFDGWYSDEAFTQPASVPTTMPKHDVTLYAKWIPVPNQYTVYHYYEKLEGGYDTVNPVLQEYVYTNDASKTKRVYTDDVLDQDRLVADNNIGEYDRYGFEIDYDKTTKQVKVAPDGSSKVWIYHKRQIHSVTYTMGDLKDDENPDVVINYRYEENIYEPELFMYGYTFKNWNPTVAEKMDIENLTYNAQWEGNPNTPYYLEYYVKTPGTDKYTMLGGQIGKLYKEGTTGASVSISDYLLEDIGYQFEKVTVNGIETDQTGSATIDPRGRLTIRYYYEALPYSLNFDPNGGVITGTAPAQYVHGTPLNIENVVAQRDGYRFLGWFEGEDSDDVMETISAFRVGDIYLVAKWVENTNTINLYDEDGSTLLGTVTATYDELIPGLENIPTKAGYDFAGYYSNDGENYYDRSGIGLIVWNQAEDISLKAKWVPKKVEINFDVNGGEDSVLSIEGTYLSKYPTLPDAARDGYEFLGWTMEGDAADSYVTDDTVIGNYNTHTLVAQWKPNEDTPYTVECYVPTTDPESPYGLFASYTDYGTTDTTATVGEGTYNIPGYVFDSTIENNVLSGNISADGNTVLKMYYQLGTMHTVTFNYGNDIPSETKQIAENEALILPSALPETYEGSANNMVLKGWKLNNVFYATGSTYGNIQSDLEFTAVWEKDSYVVYYRNNSPVAGVWEDYLAQTLNYDTSYQALGNLFTITPEYDVSGNDIAKYYDFIGWNTKADGTGTTYQPGDELLNLSYDDVAYGEKRVNLYAQWELKEPPADMVPYYVNYEIQIGTNYYKTYSVMQYGKEGKPTEAVKYTIVDSVVTPFEQQTISEYSEETGYTTVVIQYNRNKYTVTLDYNGGTFNEETGAVINNLVCGDGTGGWISGVGALSEIVPVKNGYEFVGWDVEIPKYMPTHDVTATAQYIETGFYPVKVTYSTENLDGTGYTPVLSETVYAKLGTYTPQPLSFTGFITPEAKEVTVLAEGSAVCEYQYDRVEYTLTWDAGEGTISGGEYTSGTVKYGAEITAPDLTRAGYTGTWKNFIGTMPAQNITYKPEWTPQMVAYHVMYYYKANDTNPNYSGLCSVRREALAGSIVETSSEVPDDELKATVAVGYTKPLSRAEEIAGDGSTVIEYYYDLVKSHLYYDFSGGRPTTENYAPSGDYAYGRQLQIPPLDQVEKEGYRAVGWYDISDPEQQIIEGNFITMGDKDVTYKLKWEPDVYTIAYDLDMEGAENIYNPTQYKSGFDFNIAGAICEHYGFVRWEWTGEGEMPQGVEILANGLVHVTEQAKGNLSFKAVWDPYCKIFTGKMYEGATDFYLYSYPETIDLTIGEVTPPTREGYVFEYWTKKVPDSKAGLHTVRIRDATRVSTLNVNTDYVTAKWLELSSMGDGYYSIHVANKEEFWDAIRLMKSNSIYRGIILEGDVIDYDHLTEPIFDVFEDGYVLDGNGYSLSMRAETSLFGENYGTIKNLRLYGNFTYDSKTGDNEVTYFGSLAMKNYGSITNCTAPRTYKGYISRTMTGSDATYVGGLVGYNEGIISNCNLAGIGVCWDDKTAHVNGRTVGYVGGVAGFNAYNGEIKNCEGAPYVSVTSGYMQYQDQEVYLGGYVGMNQGLVSKCSLTVVQLGSQDITQDKGEMYVGGIVGIDAPYEESVSEKDVRGIYNCTVTNPNLIAIESSHVVGGIIGECNYSTLEGNELIGVEVKTENGYAGQIAGIYDCRREQEGYNYISNAKVIANSGTDGVPHAGVVAGYCRNWGEEGRVIYLVPVRSRDDKTKITNGTSVETYKKGLFYPVVKTNSSSQLIMSVKYYPMDNLVDKW